MTLAGGSVDITQGAGTSLSVAKALSWGNPATERFVHSDPLRARERSLSAHETISEYLRDIRSSFSIVSSALGHDCESGHRAVAERRRATDEIRNCESDKQI